MAQLDRQFVPSWKSLCRAILIALFVLLGLLVAIRLLALTPIGRDYVEAQIERLTVRGQSIEIEGFEGDVFGRLHVDRFAIQDGSGVWLSGETAKITWSPLSLLSGQLRLKDVSFETVFIARRPVFTSASRSSGSNSFLSSYVIEEALLSRLTLAPDVYGFESIYSAQGSLRSQKGLGQLALNLTPLAGPEDRIDANLSWGAEAPLLGEVKLQGAANGLFSSLLGTEGGEAIEASLEAQAKGDAWSMLGTAKVGETSILDLIVEASAAKIDLEGQLDARPVRSLSVLTEKLGGPITLKGTLNRDRREERSELALVSDTMRLEASAHYEEGSDVRKLKGLVGDIQILDAERFTGLEGVLIDRLFLGGDLEYAEGALDYVGTLSIPKIATSLFHLEGVSFDGTLAYTRQGIEFEQSFSLDKAVLTRENGTPFFAAPINGALIGDYGLETQALNLSQLSLASEGMLISANGEASLHGETELQGQAILRQAAGLPVYGTMSWSLAGKEQTYSGEIVSGLRPTQPSQAFESLIGEDLNASFNLKVPDESGSASATLNVKAKAIEASGAVDLSGQTLAMTANVEIAASQFGSTGFGPGMLSLDLSGTREHLKGGIRGNVSWFEQNGIRIENLALKMPLVLNETWQGAPVISAIYLDETAELSSQVELASHGWYISNLIARYQALEMSGDARGKNVSLDNVGGRLNISGSLPNGPTLEGAFLYSDQTLSGTLDTEAISIGPAQFDSLNIDASGTWPRINVALDSRGCIELNGVRSDLALSPQLALDGEMQSVRVDLSGQIGEHVITTMQPALLKFGDEIAFDAALDAFGGRLEFSGRPFSGGYYQAKLEEIDLKALAPLLGLSNLNGKASGTLDLADRGGRLEGQALLDLSQFSDAQDSGAATRLQTTARLTEDILSLDLVVSADDENLDLTGSLKLPVTSVFRPVSISAPPDANAEMQAQGQGPLSALSRFIPDPNLRLDGQFDLDLSATGPLSKLRPSGTLNISEGVFEDGRYGLMLKAIEIEAALDQQGMRVLSSSARGVRGGSLSGAGRYAYDGSAQVNLQLDGIDPLNRRDMTASLSGPVQIGRSNRTTDVTGRLRLNEAWVDLSALPQSGYTTIDVDFDDIAEPQRTDTSSSPVRLDLDINANRRVLIIGAGIESEWAIDANIAGSPDTPYLSGSAEIIRGDANLLSRRFDLQGSRILFDGAPEETQLDIAATRSDGDLTATIMATGQAGDPTITLSSEPSYPDDEIISRILFGVSPSQLSPFQAARLAAAAAQLAGGSALDLTAPLQSAIGLERLDFGLDETGAATVSTGAYIARDIYLEVETGVTGAPGVVLEWTPLRNVEIDTTIDPELGPRVALQWKRDFDGFGQRSANEDAAVD